MKQFISLNLIFSIFLASNTLAFDHGHSIWQKVLKNFVVDEGSASFVYYKKLKDKPGELDAYLKELSLVEEKTFNAWSKEERLAFLINAYNAFTLKLIIDHYPVTSIRDIGGTFSSPWKREFFFIFGKKTHLDHIEHDLIRPKFNEPRIHFSLVCASRGCPKLMSQAFAPDEEALKSFIQPRMGLRPEQLNAAKRSSIQFLDYDWQLNDATEKKGL